MLVKWKLGLLLFLGTILVVSTPFFSRVETRHFSAYAACRKVALARKGYAVWKPEKTKPHIFRSQIIFSDGSSTLDCRTIGVGPFWIVRKSLLNWHVCDKDLGNGKIMACPEEYFGVSP